MSAVEFVGGRQAAKTGRVRYRLHSLIAALRIIGDQSPTISQRAASVSDRANSDHLDYRSHCQ
jgi:hypothetical protein